MGIDLFWKLRGDYYDRSKSLRDCSESCRKGDGVGLVPEFDLWG